MSSQTVPNIGDSSLLPSQQDQGMGELEDQGGMGYTMGQHRGPLRIGGKLHRELSPMEQQELRRKINTRERRRMKDLNVAMDALREVMVPYSPPASQGRAHVAPPGRRLSKISTLILARNYILLLSSSLQEMRRLLGEVSVGLGVGATPGPRLLLTGTWPFFTPSQLLLASDSLLAPSKCPLLPSPLVEESLLPPLQWGAAGGGTGGAPGGQLCSCGFCRLPRFAHSGPVSRFPGSPNNGIPPLPK